jgi:hypothetical protein
MDKQRKLAREFPQFDAVPVISKPVNVTGFNGVHHRQCNDTLSDTGMSE